MQPAAGENCEPYLFEGSERAAILVGPQAICACEASMVAYAGSAKTKAAMAGPTPRLSALVLRTGVQTSRRARPRRASRPEPRPLPLSRSPTGDRRRAPAAISRRTDSLNPPILIIRRVRLARSWQSCARGGPAGVAAGGRGHGGEAIRRITENRPPQTPEGVRATLRARGPLGPGRPGPHSIGRRKARGNRDHNLEDSRIFIAQWQTAPYPPRARPRVDIRVGFPGPRQGLHGRALGLPVPWTFPRQN
eukprot:scaffold2175_cov381-Prasinococcus_capsulatus_cf.AAC.18